MPDQDQQILVANGELRQLIRDVAVLTTKVENVERQLGQISPALGSVHTEQIRAMRTDIDRVQKGHDEIKDTIGKRNFVAAIISACVTGGVLMVKYLVGK